MITVFTPSHDTKYLDGAYGSLLAQTHQDWEWLVLLNGEAAVQDTWQVDDERVHVRYLNGTHGIGELKRWNCNGAKGSLLVELDHDDLLTDDCLERLWAAHLGNPGASLIFSDFAQIKADGTPDDSKFHPDMGWDYVTQEIRGQTYTVCQSMHPYPATVSFIWYAPNHVRAFPRWAYEEVGGYDATLDILDDQDLMARLYRIGGFVRVPVCLYLQRVHGENSQVRPDLNSRIQDETVQMFDRNIEANALAWAKRLGLRALDLGGAHNSPNGYLSLDLHDADLTGDVFEILGSMDDSSIGVIRAFDFLEHIPDKVGLMNEIWRVLAHGGMLLSATPSTDGRGAFQDPTHVAFWNENSFWYYTDAQYAKYVPEVRARFQAARIYTHNPTPWHAENQIPYVVAYMTAVKDGPRVAGIQKI